MYCLLREQWGRTRGTFELDHFLPVSVHPEKEPKYDNLLYCCASCNAAKRAKVLPDPCQVLIDGAVSVRDDGTIEARTKAARKLVRMLGLDTSEYIELRSLWLGIILLAERYDPALYRRLMGFPGDLPDLSRLHRRAATPGRRACGSLTGRGGRTGLCRRRISAFPLNFYGSCAHVFGGSCLCPIASCANRNETCRVLGVSHAWRRSAATYRGMSQTATPQLAMTLLVFRRKRKALAKRRGAGYKRD